MQGSDVELGYDGSDEEDSEAVDAAACNVDYSSYPIYEASMKMKYTGHRNARYVCLNYLIDVKCLYSSVLHVLLIEGTDPFSVSKSPTIFVQLVFASYLFIVISVLK